MVEIPPIGLKEEVERIDVPNALIGTDNKNVIKDESVWNGVRITHRDEQETQEE